MVLLSCHPIMGQHLPLPMGATQLVLYQHIGQYGPAPGGFKTPLWHHVSPFTHPLVQSVVSIIFSLGPDEAMLFVMVIACLLL